MPARDFTLDTEQWELSGESFPEVACGDQPEICSQAVEQACGFDLCFGSCGGTSCQAVIAIQPWDEVNLYDEKPELREIDDKPLVDVTIDRVHYVVPENTLSIDSPKLTIYLAPSTVMAPGDPQARAIGSIEPVPAGQTVADTDIDIDAEGHAAIEEFMRDYKTPFNLILGAQLELHGGDPIPTGRIVATVQVDAHAGI
jgi:hypothetical protein